MRDGYLARQLPAPMAGDPMLTKFLGIFEEIAGPLYQRAGEHHLLTSPATAPVEVVDWLNAIMGLEHQDAMPASQRRHIAQVARQVFPQRGSVRSLERLLAAYTGDEVWVTGGGGVTMDLDEQDRIERGLPPARKPRPPDVDALSMSATPGVGVVRLEFESIGTMTPGRLRALVRRLLPAHLVAEIIVQGKPLDVLATADATEQKAS